MRLVFVSAFLAGSFCSASTVHVATYIDPDESNIHYAVVGSLPSGWVFSAQPDNLGVGAAFFQTYKLVSVSLTSMTAQCNWYEYSDEQGRSLTKTSFMSTVDPSSMMWNICKRGFDLKNKPKWLQTLDAFCMFRIPGATTSTVRMSGNIYYPSETPKIAVLRVQTQTGQWTAKVVKR